MNDILVVFFSSIFIFICFLFFSLSFPPPLPPPSLTTSLRSGVLLFVLPLCTFVFSYLDLYTYLPVYLSTLIPVTRRSNPVVVCLIPCNDRTEKGGKEGREGREGRREREELSERERYSCPREGERGGGRQNRNKRVDRRKGRKEGRMEERKSKRRREDRRIFLKCPTGILRKTTGWEVNVVKVVFPINFTHGSLLYILITIFFSFFLSFFLSFFFPPFFFFNN